MDLSNVNTVPLRTSDPSAAAEIVARTGAVVVTGIEPGADAAQALAGQVFGDRIVALPPPARVREGGEMDRRPQGLDHTVASKAHTDGFAYGDRYPDHFLLACDHHCSQGGESILLDGYALLDALATDPDRAWLVDALSSRTVNQTEEGMQTSVSTIVQMSPSGRRMLRRMPNQTPVESSDDPETDALMIAMWTEAIDEAARAVPADRRPRLRSGEALVIDNYRMFHGRESYVDLDRLMWRVWVWTDSCVGVPEGMLHSDSRYAAQI